MFLLAKRGLLSQTDICRVDFSIAHAGVNDVKKHVSTIKHQENVKSASGHHSLTTLFRTESRDQVIEAEILFANFTAEHNLSFLLADHFTHLVSVMFPELLKTAKKATVEYNRAHSSAHS